MGDALLNNHFEFLFQNLIKTNTLLVKIIKQLEDNEIKQLYMYLCIASTVTLSVFIVIEQSLPTLL